MPLHASESIALAAKAIRILTVDAVSRAGIGHHGLPLGCAEIGTVLFSEFLRHDPSDPAWLDRDRFVLSAGHGSMLLYSLLHLSGYDLPMGEIKRFRQLHSRTPGHPEHGATPGVEVTSGPLGQGVGNAVGLALAERILAARFGPDLMSHRTWVLASDGDMMEGVASEAASLAGHMGLGRLIVIYDDNGITIDGPTSIAFSEDVAARYSAYGWEVQRDVDGHDPERLRSAFRHALHSDERPHLILCKTRIGLGAPTVDSPAAHGGISADAADATRKALGWSRPPFDIPEEAYHVFRGNAVRGAEERRAWEARKAKALLRDEGVASLWREAFLGEFPADLEAVFPDFRGTKPLATRQASGKILNAIAQKIPSLVGGSADLASSNSVALAEGGTIERGKFEGRNVCFGVREHGMGAIANGMALHAGVRPFVATFLVFSDYMRPAIRLAAMMDQPVIFIFTHDSIFVGEDGPTHQPVEQLASLRAIPNLHVWRPADARETVAAWQQALHRCEGPSALVLTRQGVPALDSAGVEIEAQRGGYIVQYESVRSKPELVLIGTGSEVSIVLEAGRTLAKEGRRVRVVSLPCLEVFRRQGDAYCASMLPPDAPRLVIEAGVPQGLSEIVRPGDRFHGMRNFGASAPYQDLAVEFGFTADHVLGIAREMLR